MNPQSDISSEFSNSDDPGNNSWREDNSAKSDKKKKTFFPKIFGSKKIDRDEDVSEGLSVDGRRLDSRRKAFMDSSNTIRSFSASPGIEGLNLSNFEQTMDSTSEIQQLRIFVATWNVGGKSPGTSLNLEDFLRVEESADIYICGFQEVVPLNAGNVLVIEDNEPAGKWMALIHNALNKPKNELDRQPSENSFKEVKSPNIFHKTSLKVLSKSYRAESSLLKVCNCPIDGDHRRRKLSDPNSKSFQPKRNASLEDLFSDDEECNSNSNASPGSKHIKYRLVSSKKMVGIFLTIWVKRELLPHIAHLRASSLGRGILGCLGNKGCISISMSIHKTSFCFVCSHLASGEKEGDELKRNADVVEILKGTQFSKICRNPNSRAPEKIIDHDRVFWLGDLNYRLSLSYEETRVFLEVNNWDALLLKDQLNVERKAGRIFHGFSEGNILFAPTYKYSQNSDSYSGETAKSKKKRRTPAWCDRILWSGNGIEQLSYVRGESRFSDHRPVCSVFSVEIEKEVRNGKFMMRKGYSCANRRLEYEDCIPQRHSFYEY